MAKKKKKPEVAITVSYPAPRTLSEEEAAALREKLRCAIVLVIPDRIRHSEVIVNTKFKT
jgi:hypothetical protein